LYRKYSLTLSVPLQDVFFESGACRVQSSSNSRRLNACQREGVIIFAS